MRILSYVIIFLLFSCQKFSEPTSNKDYFFPVKKYLQKELAEKSDKLTVIKTVVYNGKSESKTIKNFSFTADLKSFLDADINKASLTDKYEGDTIIQQNKKIYEYTSLNEKLKTKKVKITLDNDKVSEIRIHNEGNSVLRNFQEVLVYQPGVGFDILFDQKLVKSDPSRANINVKFQ